MFPLMVGDEFADLVADVKANGLLEPITKYQGKVLEGRNRYRACPLAGVPRRFEDYTGSDPLAFVISKNVRRRHLTQEQKRDVIAKLLKDDPERTDRATAKLASVSDKTVAPVRAELEARAEIPHTKTRIDSKGRRQPSKKPNKSPNGQDTSPAAQPPAAPPVTEDDKPVDPNNPLRPANTVEEPLWWQRPGILEAEAATLAEAILQYYAVGWQDKEHQDARWRLAIQAGNLLLDAKKYFKTQKDWKAWFDKVIYSCPETTRFAKFNMRAAKVSKDAGDGDQP
jgi:hypothetical protein